jgi:hypothetical protein
VAACPFWLGDLGEVAFAGPCANDELCTTEVSLRKILPMSSTQ